MARGYPYESFPAGWFQVAYSRELEPGQVRPLHYFGRDLVLFRSEGGEAHVLDAHCPHLGAHLGHGGRVEAECLRCPFHAWRFGPDGTCDDIPYAERIPPRARVRAWPVVEHSGLVMIWHHPDGAPPAYHVPEVEEYGDEAWTEYDCRDWRIRSRNLDLGENAVDQAHFPTVHGTATMPRTEATVEAHVLRCMSRMQMPTPRGAIEGSIESVDHGPGFQLVRVVGVLETLMVNSSTPIDAETTHVRFAYTLRRKGDAARFEPLRQAMLANLEQQMAQDIPIWENKVYRQRPLLCDGDGPIATYRRWQRQFYP